MRRSSLGFALGICLLCLNIPWEPINQDTRSPGSTGTGPITIPAGADAAESRSPHLPPVVLADYPGPDERIVRGYVRGYRRITSHNMLDHEARRRVYDLIGSHPGIDQTRLSSYAGINESTLRYHLDRMVDEELVSVALVGKTYHYFQNQSEYSEEQQRYFSRISSGTSARIMHIIRERPGITRKELADYLDMASPTVTRVVHQLAEEGYVQLHKEGRCTRHYLSGWSTHGIHTVP
jgi:DNA-binding MarR family transcriptional regulator